MLAEQITVTIVHIIIILVQRFEPQGRRFTNFHTTTTTAVVVVAAAAAATTTTTTTTLSIHRTYSA